MNADRIRGILDKASERYNEGLYEEAMTLWREVLSADPSNQNAREGIRMASLLTADWAGKTASADEPVAGGSAADPEAARARIEAGISRVRELAVAGQFAEALEGCALLEELAPDLGEVRRLTQQVRRAAGATTEAQTGHDLQQHLGRARTALAEGRNREAAEAAKAALQLDPGNMEACGILSLSADDEMAAAPVSIDKMTEPGKPAEFDTDAIPLHEITGGSQVAPETNARVRSLIAEGQAALAGGRPEVAIEIWSRVFAIDRGNTQAGNLIDQAKASLDEQARRVDDIYYRAVDAEEAGRRDEALELFEQVLAIAPNHADARASVEQLKTRAAGVGGGISIDAEAAKEVAGEKRRGLLSADGDAEKVAELLKEPASVPLALPDLDVPLPRPAAAAPIKGVAVKPAILSQRKEGGMKRVLVAVAGVLAIAAAGVGAWLWMGSQTGSMPEASATVPPSVKVPAKQAGAKNTPSAGQPAPIDVAPGSAPGKPAPPSQAAGPEQLKQTAAALTREGRQFYQEQRWAEAIIAFKKALAADPVDFDAQDQLDKAMAELQKAADLEREMTAATKYFGEGDYASALHKFYRLQQDHSEMKILDSYIENSWFNWGVTLLQAGAADEAVEKFDEVLQIDSRDQQAARAREVAKRYHGRPRDVVFESFAKALTLRSLDQR